MNYTQQRRRLGLTLGLFLGTGYALTSTLINRWSLPGIPIYAPPPGDFWTVVLTIAMFGLLGFVACHPDESLPGALVSGLAGSLLSSIWMFLDQPVANRSGTFALLVLIFLPRMFFYLPFGALTRWLANHWDQPASRPVAPARKLVPVLVSFAVLALLGSLSRYSAATRTSLVRMDAIIQEALQAQPTSRTDLPKPLQGVEGFIQNANGRYIFTIGTDPDVLPVQRPVVEYGEEEPFIIIRFENGFRFGCVFSPPYVQPACSDF